MQLSIFKRSQTAPLIASTCRAGALSLLAARPTSPTRVPRVARVVSSMSVRLFFPVSAMEKETPISPVAVDAVAKRVLTPVRFLLRLALFGLTHLRMCRIIVLDVGLFLALTRMFPIAPLFV